MREETWSNLTWGILHLFPFLFCSIFLQPTIQVGEFRPGPGDSQPGPPSSVSSGVTTLPLPPLESVPEVTPADWEVRLPPLVAPPLVPPSSLSEAVQVVQQVGTLLYLLPRRPIHHLQYNPYDFRWYHKRIYRIFFSSAPFFTYITHSSSIEYQYGVYTKKLFYWIHIETFETYLLKALLTKPVFTV